MLAQLPFELDLRHWQIWIVPVAGLAIVSVVVFLRLTGRRSRAQSTPAPRGSEPQHDPFEQGSAKEKRSAHRRAGTTVRVLVSDQDAQAEPFEGWVSNRSLNGLCLTVNREVPEGAIVSLRAAKSPTHVPWIQVQVKRTRLLGSSWELGCQFVRTPSYGDLLHFG